MVFLLSAVAVIFSLLVSFYPESAFGRTPPPKTADLLGRGEKVYEQKCAPCHGFTGNGQTRAAIIMKPPPRDFTLPFKDWDVSQGDPVQIFKIISEGSPNTAMIKFKLPREDIWALVYTVMEFSGDRKY